MQKIKSLFQRNYDSDYKIRNEIVPGSEWVISGEGWATRKWDGMALKIEDGQAYVRHLLKKGKLTPPNFTPVQSEPDPKTGQLPGWVPVSDTMKHIHEALKAYKKTLDCENIPDGTYEVCGPKIGTKHGINPEKMPSHVLVPHGKHILNCCPRDFDKLKEYFSWTNIEGVVWYHEDGRRVKVSAADFGIARKHGQL